MSLRLGELAERVGGEVRGDPDHRIEGARDLADAGPEHLSLLTHRRYLERARRSRAGALLVPSGSRGEELTEGIGCALLRVSDPIQALIRILDLLHPVQRPPAGVHPTAVVAETAEVAPSAHLGPFSVVGENSRIGADAVLEAHAVVGRDCRVGEGTWIHPHVVLYDGTELGRRCIVHSGAVLGADGFRYAFRDGRHHKVPQVGRVVVGDDVEIGAGSTIDRAGLGATRVGDGTKIDNLVQVAHNVEVGRAALLCGQAGIAGSSRLGDGVVLAGQVGVTDHVTVAEGVEVAAKSAVLGDVEAGQRVAGIPAVPMRSWRRQVVRVARLDRLEARVRELEARQRSHRANDVDQDLDQRGESQ